MTTKTKPRATTQQMQLRVEEIIARPVEVAVATPPAPLVHSDVMPIVYPDDLPSDVQPFGAWLMGQGGHKREWIAGLAKVAKADVAFPKRGTPDDVRKHLTARGADGDAFEAVDDAEMEWLRN